MRLLECIPNFSEGRDMSVIKQINEAIESVRSVRVLHVDSGWAANRTVVSFAGEPSAVLESAFRAVKKASALIDMSRHKGIHPRIGATDVLPLVPLSGISMTEVIEYARHLSARIGEELKIPVYCYEYASFSEKRKRLESVRAGEYEGLAAKMSDSEWKPDFGPTGFNKKAGATAVGARDLLVAFNVNLDNDDIQLAKIIAADVREKGMLKDHEAKQHFDQTPAKINHPYKLKFVKAIGWLPEEYGIAQVSMNLTNINITPVHLAFENVCRAAEHRGARVTGSELIGLIPLKSMLESGKYILEKQKRSINLPETGIIEHAVEFLGLNNLYHFNPLEKILEYKLKELFNFKAKIKI